MLKIVTTRERPDLADLTGRWRWEAFFAGGETSLADVLALEHACAQSSEFIPSVFVLLKDHVPVGMIAICLDDLEDRSDLNPWLAGLYVLPEHRGQGHAARLIAHLEQQAMHEGIEQLSLYSAEAVGLYRKLGWRGIDSFEDKGKVFSIMRKRIGS